MRPTLLVPLLSVAVLAACTKAEPLSEPVRAVRTTTISTDSAGGTYEYAAEVRARTESRLGFRVGGKVVRRVVNVGDSVKVGQVLAQLDPQDLKLGQAAAQASLVAAQANLDQSQADFKRFKELRDQGFISSAELERRETALKAAQAQFDQARAQASVQGNQAGYTTLVADANGVITGVDAEPGMVVAAGAPVVRLAHDGPRDVVFNVPEDKVGLLKSLAAQPSRLKARLWGSTETFPTQIREIAAAADPVTRTFAVKADLGQTPATAAVRLGQTATIVAELPRQAGVTKLPLSALRESQGQTSVWVVDKATMTVSSKPVQLAGAEGNEAVITGGVSAGDVVVTAGVHVLNPGQQVKFYVDPTAPATAAANVGTSVAVK
ncbi:efflux RND transporter periplasmic adaptor subunit [Piscinibacter sp. HJYY11]|uniref:efflux RND transporter periplasmic adaptor subunit n=1 Tax=Piscinibacter sp. HJYY11 TaxID=2801333 RepID=UPI00191EC72A|nr:efflux RND transporter periplasmic adaptor subunit [Piscinibacter sp. HJYY11]MBL0726813.1 efflux RND transporter periplasmic adaptor subunit [Piscinibacter sp. HJYY11]